MAEKTFIVDCPYCKAKVGATEEARAQQSGVDNDIGEPFGVRLYIGQCPSCETLLVGRSDQIHFQGFDANENEWSDVVRVYPKPSKVFSSFQIPRTVRTSLDEADRSLQSGANLASCVMFGRALEAVCRDKLLSKEERKTGKKIMLASGIKQLRDKHVIDARLFGWSQELHAFRNVAAHPDEDVNISREDAEDLQVFAYAIVEYIYDLAERYEEFKHRIAQRKKK
jgi:Domain of unknown function (DUF4145)